MVLRPGYGLALVLAVTCAATTAGQSPPAPVDPPASYPAYFQKLKQQTAEQRQKAEEKHAKLRQAAQKQIDARAGRPGGAGTSLGDINARMPQAGERTPMADTTANIRI